MVAEDLSADGGHRPATEDLVYFAELAVDIRALEAQLVHPPRSGPSIKEILVFVR